MNNFTIGSKIKLYRGIGEKHSLKYTIDDKPTWYAFSLEDALGYGDTVLEYEVVKPLNLINPIDGIFQLDYMSKINKIFPGTKYNGIDDRKFQALIPFGLPSYGFQQYYIKLNKIKINEPKSWSGKHDIAVDFIGNKHRYSTYERDKYLVTILSSMYDNFDGYMTNIMWPSKWHDGFFNREICIFNPSKSVGQLHKGGEKKKIKRGYIKKPKGDSWNRMNDPRLFDPKEDEKIKAFIRKGGLSDLAKEMLGME